MEENIAILIADLSGYTALTEAHGAFSAADLIDKYIEIVTESLCEDCHLHERVGDEVMVVSNSPDSLLQAALVLLQKALQQGNFLQIHGGLHYGKILKRNNSYFGAALNLTSRIASHARAGTFSCSEDFLSALADRSVCTFRERGKYSFKNVSEQKKIFEIISNKSVSLHIDPICRMVVSRESKITHPTKTDVFFCSENCRDIYLKNEISKDENSKEVQPLSE